MSGTYSTERTKNFICGTDYQKLWLMLFFRRAVNRKYSFRLATEMSAVAGFDDIVFRYEQNGTTVYMLIQVKHKEDNSKKICVGNLLTKSGELNLVKHFAAFLEIQGNKELKDKIKDFFFVTNADLDHESLASKDIAVEKIETQDDFLNIGNSARYKLIDSGGKIAEYLKQNKNFINTKLDRENDKEISNEEIYEGIKSFLDELVLAVNLPDDDKLEQLIKDEISDNLARRFRYYDENNIVFNDLFVKMSSWMKDKKGRFLSYEEGKEFFQEVEKLPSTLCRIEKKVDKIKKEVKILANNQQARKEPISFNMKYPVKTFTGRKDELKKIHEELQKNTQAEVLQIVAISGLGGIGKSELARKYACKNKEFYGGNIIWINAEDSKTIENSFLRLASRLDISTKDKSGNDKAIETIIEEIYAFFEDVKSLFIFDNVEEYSDISKFLPFSLDHKPYILITSRDRKWDAREEGDIEVILLGEFDEIEALGFVKKALNIQDNLQDKEIEELIEELQHFPLALGQAVAYIYNKNEESWNGEKFRISDYLKEYRQEAEKLFKETEKLLAGEEDGESRVRYTQTVLTTWNITRNRIADNKKYGKQAIDVLNIMAYLAPDDICIKEIFSRLIADDEEKFRNAVKLLDRYSMINLRKEVVNIHRLVQKVTKLKLQEVGKEEETLRRALELINSDNTAKEDISHIVSVWEYVSRYGKLIDEFYCKSVYIHNEIFSTSVSVSSSLHLLAQSGSYEAIEAILMHVEKHHPDQLRAVVNVQNSYDRTPLCIAIVNGKSNAVRCLVNKGAYVNARDGYNQTPLHFAVCREDLKIVEYLINGGADVNAKGRNNKTPLHYSVLCEHSNVAAYLTQRGAYIDARGKNGNTPLHLAAILGTVDIAKVLLEKGANVNAKDKDGNTPLHFAAMSGGVNIAKILLKHNAGVNIKNNQGMTALHYATNGNHQELVKLLLAHNANPILEST